MHLFWKTYAFIYILLKGPDHNSIFPSFCSLTDRISHRIPYTKLKPLPQTQVALLIACRVFEFPWFVRKKLVNASKVARPRNSRVKLYPVITMQSVFFTLSSKLFRIRVHFYSAHFRPNPTQIYHIFGIIVWNIEYFYIFFIVQGRARLQKNA